jgi:hypothetical protein
VLTPGGTVPTLRKNHVIKQPTHSKIECLREVKTETFVLERLGREIEKSDLILDGQARTRVVDLLFS